MTETPETVLKQEFDVIIAAQDNIEVLLVDNNSITLQSSEKEYIVEHVSTITTVNMI